MLMLDMKYVVQNAIYNTIVNITSVAGRAPENRVTHINDTSR